MIEKERGLRHPLLLSYLQLWVEPLRQRWLLHYLVKYLILRGFYCQQARSLLHFELLLWLS